MVSATGNLTVHSTTRVYVVDSAETVVHLGYLMNGDEGGPG